MHSTITQVLASILILLSLVKITALLVNARLWIGLLNRIQILCLP